MERDLVKYQQDYAIAPFEETMAGIRRRQLLDFIARHRFRNFLEVGCGNRPLFIELADFDSFIVIEPGEAFSEQARRAARAHDLAGRIRVVNQAFEDFQDPIPAGSVTIISSLLHELADPTVMLGHAFRLAPPGSWLHVNVPNARSFHRLWAREAGLIKTEYDKSATQIRMQQHHIFDGDGLAALVAGAGFAVAESGSYFIKPFAHAQMQRLQELGILTEDLIAGLVQMEKHAPGLGAEIYVNAHKPA